MDKPDEVREKADVPTRFEVADINIIEAWMRDMKSVGVLDWEQRMALARLLSDRKVLRQSCINEGLRMAAEVCNGNDNEYCKYECHAVDRRSILSLIPDKPKEQGNG